jgi:phosphoglycerate-specific signal transduction histidine kinase
MAVAFSNSLLGVLAAVILTILGIVSNVSDKRTALMVQIETFLDRRLPRQPAALVVPDSITRLDDAVARFDGALQSFAANTRDFHEFNLHLRDNVQRLSLAFADLSETLKAHTGALRSGHRN